MVNCDLEGMVYGLNGGLTHLSLSLTHTRTFRHTTWDAPNGEEQLYMASIWYDLMDLLGNFADSCIFMQHLQFVAYSWNQRRIARIILSCFWTWKANDDMNERVCEKCQIFICHSGRCLRHCFAGVPADWMCFKLVSKDNIEASKNTQVVLSILLYCFLTDQIRRQNRR